MSKMDYAKASLELKEHIILMLQHFEKQDEEGWNKLLKIAKFVVEVDYK